MDLIYLNFIAAALSAYMTYSCLKRFQYAYAMWNMFALAINILAIVFRFY